MDAVLPRTGRCRDGGRTGARGAREVEGKVGDRPLLFFPYGEAHAALVGIDLESAVGKTAWRVGVIDAGGARRDRSGPSCSAPAGFPWSG